MTHPGTHSGERHHNDFHINFTEPRGACGISTQQSTSIYRVRGHFLGLGHCIVSLFSLFILGFIFSSTAFADWDSLEECARLKKKIMTTNKEGMKTYFLTEFREYNCRRFSDRRIDEAIELRDLLSKQGLRIHFLSDGLHSAAENGYHDIASIILRLENGEIDDYDKEEALETAVAYGRANVVRILMQHGIRNPESRRDALFVAAKRGDIDIVRALIELGERINQGDDDGKLALHVASEYGQFDVVKVLIESGASVNKTDEYGWSALHYAAAECNDGIAKLLLKFDANPHSRDEEGKTPFDYHTKYCNK